MIGVVRDDATLALAPSPTASGLKALLAESRQAGMWIDHAAMSVNLDAVPAELGRHVYRIVQEGLTNARKHAPVHTVRLQITASPGGRAPSPDHQRDRPGPSSRRGGGVGLFGLRERVASIGGTLGHDVDEAGTHRLCARLPWPA